MSRLEVDFPEARENTLKVLNSAINVYVERAHSVAYYTPQSIVELMVDLISPKLGERILDPCFGTGGLLVSCAQRLRSQAIQVPLERWADIRQNSIHGTEINANAYAIGLARVVLAGFDDAGLELRSAFDQPAFFSPT